jgi:hypothetical protein
LVARPPALAFRAHTRHYVRPLGASQIRR